MKKVIISMASTAIVFVLITIIARFLGENDIAIFLAVCVGTFLFAGFLSITDMVFKSKGRILDEEKG